MTPSTRTETTTWTVGALLQWTQQFLTEKGVESPRLEAQILLAHVLGCERTHLYTRFDWEPGDEQRQGFRQLIQRRAAGTPVAYLVGVKDFYLLPFEVTPDVLIPRPSTESLVAAALDRLKPMAEPRVLDLCTGSGCVAVSIAHRNPNAKVTAVDLSSPALAVARRNAERHGVTTRVEFVEGDLYAPLAAGAKFDMIVSNPPYVSTGDWERLSPDVRDHEPRLALDGGVNGLAVIDRLIALAPERLNARGWLIFEIGVGQDAAARQHVEAIGSFELETTIVDGDGIRRIVVGRMR